MSRSRVRVCLQDGLRLDLNRLARKGFIKFRTNIGPRGIAWTNSYWGVVHGVISADMSNQYDAWLRIQIGDSTQQITLVWRSRHFGGHQWFFLCPVTDRLATVLWKPPGASRFRSRQAWGRQVAYPSARFGGWPIEGRSSQRVLCGVHAVVAYNAVSIRCFTRGEDKAKVEETLNRHGKERIPRR